MPAAPYLMFGSFALLAAIGDLRQLRGQRPEGARRITRHLWRVTLAPGHAAMSFFIGQADEFPARYRIMPLLAVPVVAVIVTLLYWLWRIPVARAMRRGVRAGVP